MLIAKRENVEFAQTCYKYDRQFKRQKRDFVLTNRALYIIGRQEVKDKNKKKAIIEVVKRRLEYPEINKIALSHMQDNFIVLYTNNDYATVLEIEFKTEFLTTFNRRFKELFNKPLNIEFIDTYMFEKYFLICFFKIN